jgi:outer membrane protein, heavy metal efflux system
LRGDFGLKQECPTLFIVDTARLGAWLSCLVCATAGSLAVHAGEAPLTLAAAVDRGVAEAPLLAARDAEVQAARDLAERAGRLPDPTLSVGVGNYPVTNPGAFGWRSDPMSMRALDVRQAIPSPASRAAQRDLANARIEAAMADRLATAQTVEERVANAWVGAWAYARQRALLEALRDESDLAAQIAVARLRGGRGGATDALAARAEVLTLDNELAATDAAAAAAGVSLARWLGPGPWTLAEPPDFARLPINLAQLDRAVDAQAPMRVWRAREQDAQAALAAARASKHPDWSVGVSYGNRAQGLSDTVTWELGVTLPIFARDRQDREISARIAALNGVRRAHEDARRAQTETVERAMAEWRGWGRQIELDRNELLPLARDRARIALAGYRGGASLQPWLEARRDELRERLTYVAALAARAQLWASLAYLLPAPEGSP